MMLHQEPILMTNILEKILSESNHTILKERVDEWIECDLYGYYDSIPSSYILRTSEGTYYLSGLGLQTLQERLGDNLNYQE